MSSNHTPIAELAKMLRMDRSHLLRFSKKLSIQPVMIRTRQSRNQLTVAFNKESVKRIFQARMDEGYSLDAGGSPTPVDTSTGFFYVLQLVPDLDPHRVKFGFTNNLTAGLADHHTTCPHARYMTTFKCRREWEAALTQFITKCLKLKWIGGEVFRGDPECIGDYMEVLQPYIFSTERSA